MVRTDIIVPVSSLFSLPPDFSSRRELLGVVVVVDLVVVSFFIVDLKVKSSWPRNPSYDNVTVWSSNRKFNSHVSQGNVHLPVR